MKSLLSKTALSVLSLLGVTFVLYHYATIGGWMDGAKVSWQNYQDEQKISNIQSVLAEYKVNVDGLSDGLRQKEIFLEKKQVKLTAYDTKFAHFCQMIDEKTNQSNSSLASFTFDSKVYNTDTALALKTEYQAGLKLMAQELETEQKDFHVEKMQVRKEIKRRNGKYQDWYSQLAQLEEKIYERKIQRMEHNIEATLTKLSAELEEENMKETPLHAIPIPQEENAVKLEDLGLTKNVGLSID